jgi:outer membrane immunogenic protein
MRKLFLLVGLMFLITIVNAQNPLGKGKKQLNAGLGFSNWGLPVYVGLDFGVHPDISVGAEICFHSYNERYNNSNWHHNVLGISANGNYHFNRIMNIPSTWDFYAGLNIGFNFWNSPDNYHGSYGTGLGLGAQIGGRYFLSKRFGLNLELGGGNASTGGKFGITYQF